MSVWQELQLLTEFGDDPQFRYLFSTLCTNKNESSCRGGEWTTYVVSARLGAFVQNVTEGKNLPRVEVESKAMTEKNLAQ